MDFAEYQTHKCRAYLTNHLYRNPWEHKIMTAEWKRSKYLKGTLKAKGSVTEPQQFPWVAAIIFLAAGAIACYLLWHYG